MAGKRNSAVSAASNKDLSSAQNRKIWAMARSLNIDKEMLHALAFSLCGKESIKNLTNNEAIRLIDELQKREKGQGDFRYVVTTEGRPRALATKKQLWKIDQLVNELGWADNPKRLKGFCQKYAKTDDVRWLTKEQAWRLIEGLKKLLAKNSKEV